MTRAIPDPGYAVNTLERYKEAHKRLPSSKKNLLYLLSAYSRFLGKAIVKDPEILNALINSEFVERKKSFEIFQNETLEIFTYSNSLQELMISLRRYKYQELSRIIYRDIQKYGSFTEIMEELSDLAGSIIEAAFRFSRQEIKAKLPGKFVILAMGKLGGRELNLSSDIDIIYLYDTDKDPYLYSNISEMITKILSSITEFGFLFRVDLGLRPGGNKSPISVSLEWALEHYFYWGDTWERAALIKSRPVAGDLSLGEQFIEEIEPFVYKKYLDYSSIEDLKDMKTKLDKLHKMGDVKLGRGGIRDIEFFVQALQLVNGGALKEIRESNTLKALEKLYRYKLIEGGVSAVLSSSYLFLRKLEHAIQLIDEVQTHKVPRDSESLGKISKMLGFRDNAEFEKAFVDKTTDVSKIFDRLFYEPSRKVELVGKEFWELADFLNEGNVSKEDVVSNLGELGFSDPDSAVDIISVLLDRKRGGLTQRGRILARKIIPAFLSKVLKTVDPDAALRNLERFISTIGLRTSILSMLAENPEIIDLLSRLFSTTGYLSNFLIRHPEYLDVLTLKDVRSEYQTKEEMVGDLRVSIDEEQDYETKINAIRKFKHSETLRLCLRDLNNEVDSDYVGKYISMIADSTLEVGLSLAIEQTVRKYVKNKGHFRIVVIGLGKLGGTEMSYNSDLDIIFIYDGKDHELFSKVGGKLISILSIPTSEGYAFKIDMGLRPSGRSGALVSSFDSFKQYHEKSAQLWERQSLIKSRPVAGDMELGKKVMKTIKYFVYEKPLKDNFYQEIHHLRSRIEREIAMESKRKLNLKTGKGGLVDIEFIVQMLQLKFGGEYKELRRQNTVEALEALKSLDLIEEREYKILKEGLYFLKRLENILRLLRDRSISELYENDFSNISVYLGTNGDGEELRRLYISKTTKIRQLYEKYFF